MMRITNQKRTIIKATTAAYVLINVVLCATALICKFWALAAICALQLYIALSIYRDDQKQRVVGVNLSSGNIEIERFGSGSILISKSSIEEIKVDRNTIMILFRRNEELLDHTFKTGEFDANAWKELKQMLSAYISAPASEAEQD